MNPHQLADERVQLSVEYSNLSEELSDILTVKAPRWSIIRADPECKSDKVADRKWDATNEGIREMQIRLKLKAWEKRMSAIGTMLRVLEAEGRNQF